MRHGVRVIALSATIAILAPSAMAQDVPVTAPVQEQGTAAVEPDPAAPPAAEATPIPTPVVEEAATSGAIAAPPAGKGQIVFFREKKFQGSFVRYKVREGDQELGKLGSGTYFVHVTDPGVHEYTVHSEAKDILTLEVEDGETYYVQGGISMGMFVGRPNLSPSDPAVFEGMAGKLEAVAE